MKKIPSIFMSFGLMLFTVACSAEQKQQPVAENSTQIVAESAPVVDWTPVFSSWQEGCIHSAIFQNLRQNLYYFDEYDQSTEADKAKTGKIVLPAKLLASVHPNIEMSDTGESREFTLRIKNGVYHGMKLTKIGVYVGNGNGINGSYIEVEQSDAALRQFFKDVKFERDWNNPSEYGHDLATLNVQDRSVIITCDSSM